MDKDVVHVPNRILFDCRKEGNPVIFRNVLEHIMLNEIRQAQKDKFLIFSLICGRYNVGLIKVECRMVVNKG
jgi:hypothetical protein